MSQDPNRGDEPNSRVAALAGLAVVAVLVLIGYYLVTTLRHQGQVEDCLMSGRTNCAPIEAPSTGR